MKTVKPDFGNGRTTTRRAFCSSAHSARGRPESNRKNACRYVTMVSCLKTSRCGGRAPGLDGADNMPVSEFQSICAYRIINFQHENMYDKRTFTVLAIALPIDRTVSNNVETDPEASLNLTQTEC